MGSNHKKALAYVAINRNQGQISIGILIFLKVIE